MRKVLASFWKFFAGVVLCQSLPGSVIVLGWVHRLTRRSIIRQWWKRSVRSAEGQTFSEFLAEDEATLRFEKAPRWVLLQPGTVFQTTASETEDSSPRPGFLTRCFHSLWLNFKTGAQAIFNVWTFTLPGCALWLFAWYSGWDNSFNKGYEQFWVGPATGWLGVFLFIGALFYVPLAAARQAATGDWKSFYHFGLVRSLAHSRWKGCLLLAGLYSLLSLPVYFLKCWPLFMEQSSSAFEQMSDAAYYNYLENYYLLAACYVFPCFVLLRVAAGRLYAAAVLDLAKANADKSRLLAENERKLLERLHLLNAPGQAARSPLPVPLRMGGKLVRAAGKTAAALLWFSLVSQIFVSEFLVYHPGIGWLNQPTVQLPWFNYIPRA